MSDAVQQVKDKLDIVEVIAPYVELQRAGKNYKGKSPFSAEKTPSFYVSPDRGMYYCFSTSQGGDMFTFIQAIEGVDFKEALRQLAQKAGVELVREDPKQRSQRDRWYAALAAAADFYADELSNTPAAREYLERRAVTPATMQAWQIGYAPGPPRRGWRETKGTLEQQGYQGAELLQVGLIKQTDSGKEPFDVFRDRIVFPMCEPSGRVVAFSGRILSPDSDAPKYVNSPETPLYKKSELLFGYDKAKQGIRTLGFSLVVEGQFDVVMAHQAGYTNTVAVSGTALTAHHVGLLRRLSDRVVLALDADRAGIAAMQKAATLLLQQGMDVKVAPLPEGADPADIIARDGGEFKQVISQSVHVIEFLLQHLLQDIADPRTRKLQAREQILPFVLLLPNRIDQEHFVGIIATAIGSTSEAIRYEVDRLRETERDTTLVQPAVAEPVASPSPEALSSGMASAYVYLCAVAELLPAKLAAILTHHLEALPEHQLEVDAAALAKATFTLEEQLAQQPQLAQYEDMVHRLNYLRTKLLQQQLAACRAELTAAQHADGDDAAILARILELQQALSAPQLTTDIFTREG